jgi:hypothetical protein
VSYGAGQTAANDFAKQLMAALQALLTTVIGFYFGAKTATSSASATADQMRKPPPPAPAPASGPAPNPTAVAPPSYSVAAGPSVPLVISGTNLNSVVHANVVRTGSAPVALTGVASNQTQVTGQLAVTAAMAGPAWDVIVDDGAGHTSRLPGGLTITA